MFNFKPVSLVKSLMAKNILHKLVPDCFMAVTGTFGLPVTIKICSQVLAGEMVVHTINSDLNDQVNFTESLLKIPAKVNKVIIGIGLDKPANFVPPIMVVTQGSFNPDIGFGNALELLTELKAKVKVVPPNGLVLLNWEDLTLRQLAAEISAKVIFYGYDREHCLVWADKVRLEQGKTVFELNHGVERAEISLSLLGKHFIDSALAGAALGIYLGIPLTRVKKGLEKTVSFDHQMKLLDGTNGCTIIDDNFDFSFAGLEKALDVLNSLPGRRRIAAISTVKDLGFYSEEYHRKLAQKMYNNKVDLILLAGDESEFLADELARLGCHSDQVEKNLSNSQIVSKILTVTRAGDIVLVKGSKFFRFDEIVKRITKN